MKKPETTKLISLIGLVLFAIGCFWVIAQSDENRPLTIETNKFTAVQHIQEIHLNQKVEDSIEKIWLKNADGKVLGIGSINPEKNRVWTLKNSVKPESPVIAGSGNENKGGVGSLIIGGENNTLIDNNSVILWGLSNSGGATNSVILASSGVDINSSADGSLAMAVTNGSISGKGSSAYAGKDITLSAPNTLAMGSNIALNNEGTFAFNGSGKRLSSRQPHTFLVNGDYGMIVGTTGSKASVIQLTVSGAIRVGTDACSSQKIGSIYKKSCGTPEKAFCLCWCGSEGVQSLSANPSCAGVCKGGNQTSCIANATCGTRAIEHEAGETDWRIFSNFCADGAIPAPATPTFPDQWGSSTWTCPSAFGGSNANCSATRKVPPVDPATLCGKHATGFPMATTARPTPTSASDFCANGATLSPASPLPVFPNFTFPETSKTVEWACVKGAQTAKCSASKGCNQCAEKGFPYCFPVNFDSNSAECQGGGG